MLSSVTTQFEKIPLSEERQKATLYQQIDEIVDGIRQAKEAGAENFTIKQMEGTRKKLEAKLTKLTTGKTKDHAVTFEETGRGPPLCRRVAKFQKSLRLYQDDFRGGRVHYRRTEVLRHACKMPLYG